ncbi:hypothetical protein [Vibrio owensii]|uniref:hypothetical protein n=1 Tax=Vibrio owensii TaxID=696485 RepID=UPI004068B042
MYTAINHAQLMTVSNEYQMPRHFQCDIKCDADYISAHRDKSYLWVLKQIGTQLMPIRSGVNPGYVVNWIEQDSSVKVFLISGNRIEAVSHDDAIRIANEPPASISLATTQDRLIKTVEKVLSDPIATRGVFSHATLKPNDNWHEWREYFKSIDNPVMEAFMASAIKKSSSIKQEAA